MTELVEFKTEDGTTVVVEVNEQQDSYQRVSTDQDDDTPRSLKSALDRIQPVADDISRRLISLATQPDSIDVEFGIKLSGKVGALIASTGTEANFSVKLHWDRQR